MKRNLLLVASLFFGAVAFAQDCVAVTALNEDFSTFTGSGALPQKCWTGSNAFPMVYVDNALDLATIYTSTAATLPIYLVSPELSNIDGAHTLTFDVSKLANSAAGVLTLQVGTLATATDFANFAPVGDLYTLETTATSVEIVIPANATQKFIAFKIISSVNHMAAGIDNVVWSATDVPTPPCVAVASISEDFSTFNVLQNPANVTDNCWSTSATGPLLYADTNTDNTDTFVTFYANGSADTASYLVSPELVAIDGTLKLSFDAAYAGGPGFITTVQAGTIATTGDFANFHPVGEVITLTSTETSITDLEVPSTSDKFIAFKFTTNFAHGAASIDNVKYDTTAGIGQFDKSTFSIFPNPSVDKNITINHNLDAKGTVNVYTLTGSNVFSGELSNTGSQSLTLSSLSTGIYIVKIEAGNFSESKKLIIQ